MTTLDTVQRHEIPEGWEWRKLGEICDVTDRDHRTPSYQEHGVPLISPKDFTDHGIDLRRLKHVAPEEMTAFVKKCKPEIGDILYSRIGTIGEARLVDFDLQFVALHSIAMVKPRLPGLMSKFVLYLLQSPAIRSKAKHNIKSVGTPDLGLTRIRDFEVPVPPPAVQKEIVAELEKQFSRLDEAVANLQRVKANLKRYKDSVYSEAFGSAPNSTLGDLIEVGPQNGLYLPKDMYGDGVPILRIDDYQTAWIRPVQELRRVKATQEQRSTWAMCENDLVVNRVNSMTHLGKCVRIPKSLTGSVFESNMMRMRLTSAASPAYVEHYLASRLGKKRLTENAKWAVNQASINQKDVRATPIFIPDLATQLELVTEIDRQLSIVREVEAEVDTNLKRAQALRQATLAKAFAST